MLTATSFANKVYEFNSLQDIGTNIHECFLDDLNIAIKLYEPEIDVIKQI